MEDIPHIGRNVVEFRYPNQLGGQQSAERDSGSLGEWQGDQYKENYSSQAWRGQTNGQGRLRQYWGVSGKLCGVGGAGSNRHGKAKIGRASCRERVEISA